jgi:predicted DNA-binding protein YlxM (UPF0122 family)
MLEKTTRMNLLYDFYQGLLTDKQRLYTQLYYSDDLSLSEIAEHLDVSRQAVFDNIKRAEQLLEHYEQQLRLLEKHQTREKLFEEAIDLLNATSASFPGKAELMRVMAALKNVD